MVAGEASGDMHGAHLARALIEKEPRVRLFGMGGSKMEQAGVRLLYNPTSDSVMGFVEVLKNVQVMRRLLTRFADVLDEEAPDVVTLIDFPEFNMRLANLAKERGIPSVYYFSPSAWAWRRGRARTIAEQGATVCAVFPFEADVYREAGAKVEFVGHPLIDIAKPGLSKDEARAEFDCAGRGPVVALLPGSRKQEIDGHVQIMAQAARKILAAHPGAAFLIPLAHTVERARVEALIGDTVPVTIVDGRAYDVLAAADVAIAVSGTVTLEAALIGTPIVVVYKASVSMYVLAKAMYKLPWISLPNIVAGRKVVDEVLQSDFTADGIAAKVEELLRPERRNEVLQGYQEVREKLGGPGAVGRAADTIIRIARRTRGSEGGPNDAP